MSIIQSTDYIFTGEGRKRLGIASSGKAWLDVMETLSQLGIDCHGMARFVSGRKPQGCDDPYGAEGATWIGEPPLTNRPQTCQNLNDGTYFHLRLMTRKGFFSQLGKIFEGDYHLRFNFAPLKIICGITFDIFGYSEHRAAFCRPVECIDKRVEA